MQRWTRPQGEQLEFWEVGAEGQVLRERWGLEGQPPQTREQHCDNDATCERIRLRMVAQREREGFVAAAGAPSSASEKRKEIAAFGELTPKKLASIALKLDAIVSSDSHKHRMELSKTVSWQDAPKLLWHLVEHRAVKAESNLGLLSLLAESPDDAPVELLFELLARLPRDPKKLYPKGYTARYFTDGSCREVDALLFSAARRAEGLFAAREAELAPWVRDGLDFVRGRMGIELAPDTKKRILEQIARNQCTQWGLTMGWELPLVEGGGVVQQRMQETEDVRAVALRFGTPAEWSAAIVRAALEQKFDGVHSIRDALVACTARELAALLSKPFSFGDNRTLAYVIGIVEGRDDSPTELLDAAHSLVDRTDLGKQIRELLAVVAARRFAERGEPVPESLDALLRFEFFSGVYFESIRPYIAGLRALPRERAHALARERLAQPFQYQRALAALIAHPDDALLREIFEKDTTNCYLEPRVVGELGSPALEHLARIYEQTPRDRRRSRAQQILQALAFAADRGEPIDPQWDEHVRFDDEGGEKLEYWSEEYAALRRRVIAGLPIERRNALLLARLEKDKDPTRSLSILNLCDDDAFERGVRVVLERRSGVRRPELRAALAALGERLVPALVAAQDTFAKDREFVAFLREALPASTWETFERALKSVGQS